jgi:hypothetical protein
MLRWLSGTDRLRRIINKGNSEDLERAVTIVLERGWQSVAYFMVGLPHSQMNLDGIIGPSERPQSGHRRKDHSVCINLRSCRTPRSSGQVSFPSRKRFVVRAISDVTCMGGAGQVSNPRHLSGGVLPEETSVFPRLLKSFNKGK